MTRAGGAVVLLGIALAAGCARDRTPPVASPAAEDGPAVEPARLDLGTTVPGGSARGLVRVTTKSGAPVRLVAFETSCDCTTATVALPADVGPGSPLEVPIDVDLSKLPEGGLPAPSEEAGLREIVRHATARDTSGREARAEVVLRVTDQLVVRPALLDFGEIAVGAVVHAPIGVEPGRSAGGALPAFDLTVDGHDALTVDLMGDSAADVALGPVSAPGTVRGRLQFALTGRPEVEWPHVEVRARVVPAVRVEPPSLERLEAPTQRPVIARFHVLGAAGRPVRVLKAWATDHNVRTEVIPANADAVTAIEVVIPVRPPPGEVRAELVVETDAGSGATVRVPLLVRARAP